MNTAIIIFIVCTFANVIISTIKSVMTIKGGKCAAAVWNALAFGLYAYIVVLTATAPVSTIWKVAITAGCNLVGVFCVKLAEEKMRKDRLWLVKTTITANNFSMVKNELEANDIPFTYYDINKYFVFDTFCETHEQTLIVYDICKKYNGKIFAAENKLDIKI